MSSLEMDCSEPLIQNTEEKEQSLTNTVEMTSVYDSLESNTDMDLTECPEDGSEESEDGSEDQDSQKKKSGSNDSSSDEDPPSQGQSPIFVKVLVKQVKAVSTEKSQEVSCDYGSQDVEEESSGRVKSPITVKVQTTTTNGSQEVSPDRINGNLVQSPIASSSLRVQVTTNGSQELLDGNNNGSQVNSETEICVTLSRENSNGNRRNLKRKSGSAEEEGGKEKKFK